MATDLPPPSVTRPARWTRFIWAGAAILLAIPFVAMRFTSEVNWTLLDFVVMGSLLAIVCGMIEVAARRGGTPAYKLGTLAGVGGGFVVMWINLAVGHEHAPYDLNFYAALGLGLAIAAVTRFRPSGMMVAMLATALGLVVALRLVMVAEMRDDDGNLLVSLVSSTLVAAPFLVAAWLFHRAGRAKKIGMDGAKRLW